MVPPCCLEDGDEADVKMEAELYNFITLVHGGNHQHHKLSVIFNEEEEEIHPGPVV